ncbi:MAG TPA: hypothetical protein VIH30_09165 [Aquirhabdus sp.]
MGNSGLICFENAYEITPATTGSYVDVDVSPFVPAGASGVLLEFSNYDQSAARKFSARKKGSTDDHYELLYNGIGGHNYFFCGLDSNRKLQVKIETSNCKIWLIGYTDSKCAFFDNAYDFSNAQSAAWIDKNASTIVPADAVGVFGYFIPTTTIHAQAILRTKGSTEDTAGKNLVRGIIGVYTGINESKLFQYYTDTITCKLFIIGYSKAPIVWFTNPVKKGPLTLESTWQEISCGSNVPSGANAVFVELVNFNGGAQQPHVTVRKKGSTDNRGIVDSRIRYTGHAYAVVGISADGKFEAFFERDIDMAQDISLVEFWLHGYAMWDGIHTVALQHVNAPSVIYLGSTNRFQITVKDEDGNAIDADSFTITMKNPYKTSTDLSSTIVKASAGVYNLDYTFSASNASGKWTLTVNTVKTGKTRINKLEITVERV